LEVGVELLDRSQRSIQRREPIAVQLWTIDLDQAAITTETLLPTLDRDERLRADRFVAQRDRQRFISGRFAMRSILGQYLNLKPVEVALGAAQYGKPVLLDSPALRFNLSHSEGLAVLALHERDAADRVDGTAMAYVGSLGVDIEWARPLDDVDQLHQHCLCERERRLIQTLSQADQLTAFYEIWVRKEAALKALGLGFQVEPHTFDAGWLSDDQSRVDGLRGTLNIAGYPTIQVLNLDDFAVRPATTLNPRERCHAAVALVSARPVPSVQAFRFGPS
jgi:4'-phosphopantetheinyl transferase